MPPYEPPRERFTPPREVIGTPIGAKGNKRKQPAKRPAKQLKLVIKEEPPELDLTQPAPPASPTEDPLLLAGPPERSGTKPVFIRSTATPQAAPSLPATSSPWEGSQMSTAIGYIGNDTSDTSMDAQPREDDVLFPMGEWSDSDGGEDAFDQSGEYTGKFTTVRVPTKADPPTSITKDRQDAWGRPVSPFPYPNRRTSRWSSPIEPSSPSAVVEHDLPGLDDDNLDQMNIGDLSSADNRPALDELADTNLASDTVHPGAVEASSPFNLPVTDDMSTPFAQSRLITSAVPSMFNFADMSSTPANAVPRFSMVRPTVPVKDVDTGYEQPSPDTVTKPLAETVYEEEQSVAEEEEEEEQLIDRELSHGLYDDAPAYSFQLPETPTPAWDTSLRQRAPQASTSFAKGSSVEIHDDESEGSDEDDDELDQGVIKITSEDPMAAARAAAILKLVRSRAPSVVHPLTSLPASLRLRAQDTCQEDTFAFHTRFPGPRL